MLARVATAIVALAMADGVPIRTDTGSGAITAAPFHPERSGSNATKPQPALPRPDAPASVPPGRPSLTVPTNKSNLSVGVDTGTHGGIDVDAGDGTTKTSCERQCKPSIDKNHSVIAAFAHHRAQAALIGDYGKGPKSCTDDNEAERVNNATHYTWTVDWGDEESYTHREETVWPYQAVHEYHKKGKYKVDVTFCHHMDGCEPSCAKHKQVIHVKP